jgi:type III secretion protein J
MARALVAAGLLLLAAGCDAVVRDKLSEAQANQIVVALDAASIAGRKVAGPNRDGSGYRVEVAASELNAALRVLQQQGLPAPDAPDLDRLLQPSGLVATPEEERVRLSAAHAGELARSLERIQGVVNARVHLVLPSALRPLDAAPAPAQAAVLLVRGAGAAAIDETSVRRLVAAAVSGLDPGAVTIVQTQAVQTPQTAVATVRVGPFSVRRESAPLLKGVLALALSLDLAMALALIWAVRRKRAAHREAA